MGCLPSPGWTGGLKSSFSISSDDMISSDLVNEIVSILKNTGIFNQFYPKWSGLARSLGTKSCEIKKIRSDLQLEKLTQTDAIVELLETWIGRRGGEAKLLKLVEAFQDNDLEDCAKTLQDRFGRSTSTRAYAGPPKELEDFLAGTKSICLLSTLDPKITCDKISEYRSFLNPADVTDSQSKSEWALHLSVVEEAKELEKVCAAQLQSCSEENHPIPKIVIVTNLDMESISEIVRPNPTLNAIAHQGTDTIRWDDLSSSHRDTIKKRILEFHHWHHIPYKFKKLRKKLYGEVLVSLINGRSFKRFGQTLPTHRGCYLSRCLLVNKVISEDVFGHDSSDIFLVAGMELSELGQKVELQSTDTAASQLKHSPFTVNFMTFDKESNEFDSICERARSPVHVLSYEGGVLLWKESCGSIVTIQKFLKKDAKYRRQKEEVFFKNVSVRGNRPFCIAGPSGSGKSAFLARVGRFLSGDYESDDQELVDRSIFNKRTVIFITANELINKIKAVEPKPQKIRPTKRSILKALKGHLCKNDMERYILSSKFKRDELSCELLLSSFDEVDSHLLSFAHNIVRKITKFRFIRLWVTSRLHLLEELERSLGVLSYRLGSFCNKHEMLSKDCTRALDYLKSHLKCDSQASTLDETRLHSLATSCLSAYVSESELGPEPESSKNGLVLTCLLLAKLFEREALGKGSIFDATSIFSKRKSSNVHQLLIDNRIENYLHSSNVGRGYDSKTLMDMHHVISLKCLFPKSLPDKPDINSQINLNVPWEDVVLQVGLVDKTSSPSSPCFIHRSFAHYFLIWFLVDELKKGCPPSQMCTDSTIWRIVEGSRGNVLEFIESKLLSKQYITPCQQIHFEEFDNLETMMEVAACCAKRNFCNIFDLLLKAHAFQKHEAHIFNKDLFKLVITHSCLKFVKLVLFHYEQHNKLEQQLLLKSLQWAVNVSQSGKIRGKYAVIEFLIKEKGLRELLRRPCKEFETLIHICVEDSRNKDGDEIENRKNIICILSHISPSLLNMRNGDNKTPRDCRNIHKELYDVITCKKERHFPLENTILGAHAYTLLALYPVSIIFLLLLWWICEHTQFNFSLY